MKTVYIDILIKHDGQSISAMERKATQRLKNKHPYKKAEAHGFMDTVGTEHGTAYRYMYRIEPINN